MGRYRVGCMGWGYDDWVGPFYPSGAAPIEYLSRYARVFDFTEVDSSFYRAPSPFLARRWASSTPDGFLFSLKIPQEITHRPGEQPMEAVLRGFLDGIEPIRASGKLGPIVAQFPPSFRRDKGQDRLLALLAAVPKEYRLAIELRHASWWTPEVLGALRDRGAALVWAVVPGARAPFELTAEFAYARFVGDRALTTFDHLQRDLTDEIRTMKSRLESEGWDARDVFLLVNNHFMGYGPGTARKVQEVFGLTPADLGAAARVAGQRRLEEEGPAPSVSSEKAPSPGEPI